MATFGADEVRLRTKKISADTFAAEAEPIPDDDWLDLRQYYVDRRLDSKSQFRTNVGRTKILI